MANENVRRALQGMSGHLYVKSLFYDIIYVSIYQHIPKCFSLNLFFFAIYHCTVFHVEYNLLLRDLVHNNSFLDSLNKVFRTFILRV